MAIEIIVPRLGWTMETGTFVRWLKADGETVQAGEMLFELEGEKAIQEVEATDGGILRISPHAPQPGEAVAVGTLLGCLVAAGEPAPWETALRPRVATRPVAHAVADASVDDRVPALSGCCVVPTPVADAPHIDAVSTARRIATPRARRVARELGIAWTRLRGSGRNGRIRERDVRVAASPGTAIPRIASAEPQELTGRLLPHTSLRRAIAARMVAGVNATAPVTLTATADATALVALRKRLKAESHNSEIVPTYNDLLIKLVASALQEHPVLNAQWRDEGIFVPDSVNIALAVQTNDGLVAPVVRNVSDLSLQQIADRVRELIELAKERKLTSEQMQGGTFTITNLGKFGIEFFTPIITVPQCAVLGIGQIRRTPVVQGNEILIRDILPLSLTFDHRIVDGAPAAQFLQSLCRCIADSE